MKKNNIKIYPEVKKQDFRNVFHSLSGTSLSLINSVRNILRDEGGKFVYSAESYDGTVVTFLKKYI